MAGRPLSDASSSSYNESRSVRDFYKCLTQTSVCQAQKRLLSCSVFSLATSPRRCHRLVFDDVRGINPLEPTFARLIKSDAARVAYIDQCRAVDSVESCNSFVMVARDQCRLRFEKGNAAHVFDRILGPECREHSLRRSGQRRCQRDRETRRRGCRRWRQLLGHIEPRAVTRSDSVDDGAAETLVRVNSPRDFGCPFQLDFGQHQVRPSFWLPCGILAGRRSEHHQPGANEDVLRSHRLSAKPIGFLNDTFPILRRRSGVRAQARTANRSRAPEE
jgi:hypothetical protein